MPENDELRRILASGELFASAFEDSPIAMGLVDAETNIRLAVNRAFLDLFGQERDYFEGKNAGETGAWADAAQRDALFRTLAEAGEFHSQPVSLFRKGNQLRYGLASGKRIQVGNRKCYLFQILDVTERELAGREVLESKKKFEFLFNRSPLAMLLTNIDEGVFLDVNPAFEKLLGFSREELVGKVAPSLQHLFWYEDRKKLLQELKAEHQILGRELQFYTKDRTLLTLRCSFVEAAWEQHRVTLTILEDITAMRRAEEETRAVERELAEAKRLDSLGRLAGGIAHDFNNILAGIMGQVDLMKLKDHLDAVPLKRLESIGEGSKRARDLVRKILSFSRQQSQPHKVVPLGKVIREALDLLETQAPTNVRITFEGTDAAYEVFGDPSQLHEVVMNLVTNSLQAMGPSQGFIRVELGTVVQGDGSKMVEVTLEDSGSGIDPAVLPNIFEPFFTTKGVGSGTGLGLSVVHGIIKELGGTIEVQSTLGKGTTFRIRLPLVESTLSIETENSDLVQFGSGETILLVDDEPMVLEATGGLLDFLGYTVVSCSSGNEALQIFNQPDRRFDAVVADLSMPEMGGIDLARRLSQLGSKVPVILTTSYMNTATSEVLGHVEIAGLLSKPVATAALSREVHRVLGLSRGRAPRQEGTP